ncbi:MAG: hypothetical protein QXT73_01370 [Candidatus Methanomethylicaceae archaeon]
MLWRFFLGLVLFTHLSVSVLGQSGGGTPSRFLYIKTPGTASNLLIFDTTWSGASTGSVWVKDSGVPFLSLSTSEWNLAYSWVLANSNSVFTNALWGEADSNCVTIVDRSLSVIFNTNYVTTNDLVYVSAVTGLAAEGAVSVYPSGRVWVVEGVGGGGDVYTNRSQVYVLGTTQAFDVVSANALFIEDGAVSNFSAVISYLWDQCYVFRLDWYESTNNYADIREGGVLELSFRTNYVDVEVDPVWSVEKSGYVQTNNLDFQASITGLVEGTGISLSRNGRTYTISATGGGGSGDPSTWALYPASTNVNVAGFGLYNAREFVGVYTQRVALGSATNNVCFASGGALPKRSQNCVLLGYAPAGDMTTNVACDYNVCIGYEAGYSATGGNSAVYIGRSAGSSRKRTTEDVCIGYNAGASGSGSAGSIGVCIGSHAGYNSMADVAIGWNAGANASGLYNQFIGYQAGQNFSNGQFNCVMGYRAGYQPKSIVEYSVLLGANAGYSISNSSSSVAVGQDAMNGAMDAYESVAVGREAMRNAQGYYNVCIGSSAGKNAYITNSIGLGRWCLLNAKGAGIIAFGDGAGRLYSGGSGVLIGSGAGMWVTSTYCVALGPNAACEMKGNNIPHIFASGNYALRYATSGHGQIFAVGPEAGLSSTGSYMMIWGHRAGQYTSMTGAIVLGYYALASSGTSEYTIAIGYNAGWQDKGPNNIFLGASSGSGGRETTNAIVIGTLTESAFALATNALGRSSDIAVIGSGNPLFLAGGRVALKSIGASDPNVYSAGGQIYVKTVSSVPEVCVMDGAGNVTQISAHRGTKPVHYSYNKYTGEGREIDLELLAEAVQALCVERAGSNPAFRKYTNIVTRFTIPQEMRSNWNADQSAAEEASRIAIELWEAATNGVPKGARPERYVPIDSEVILSPQDGEFK